MKVVAYVLGLLVLGLTVGYLYVSQPIPTIADAVNPDGVHNLHLIDENSATGFAIYRLGQPDADDVRGMCALGIEEIVVLAGSALEYEEAYKSECPSLKVIYNVEDTLAPVSGQWLDYFDNWVSQAQASGKKIAFRCSCGCHRTGRLAAYYQMKYRGLTAKEAWDLALARGKVMEAVDYFSGLQQQIIALHEYINGQGCSQGEYCVVQSSPQPPCDDPLQGCGWSSAVL